MYIKRSRNANLTKFLMNNLKHERISMKKNGFTLAEILVTLGIIGIVSAITVPSLMSNFQKKTYETSIKKAYNTVSNAVSTYMANEGIDDLSQAPIIGDVDELKKFVNKYFKVVTDCGSRYYTTEGNKCFGNPLNSLEHSATANLIAYSCQVVVQVADGMSYCFDMGNSETGDAGEDVNGDGVVDENDKTHSNGVLQGAVLSIEVDTNGVAGPNTTGRDIFAMSVNQNGTVFDPQWNSTFKKDSANVLAHYRKKAEPMGIGMIQASGWQMNY